MCNHYGVTPVTLFKAVTIVVVHYVIPGLIVLVLKELHYLVIYTILYCIRCIPFS